jgi:hypothetical protein
MANLPSTFLQLEGTASRAEQGLLIRQEVTASGIAVPGHPIDGTTPSLALLITDPTCYYRGEIVRRRRTWGNHVRCAINLPSMWFDSDVLENAILPAADRT